MGELPDPKGSGDLKINIRYLFAMCNDIDAMRHFYTDVLGMKEVSYMSSDDFGWLCYQSDGFQLMFFRAQEKLVPEKDWTWQPGYGGGPNEGISWGTEYPKELFITTYKKIIAEDCRALFDDPQWFQESYWGFPVLDPMGNTIELFWSPDEKPETPEWKDQPYAG